MTEYVKNKDQKSIDEDELSPTLIWECAYNLWFPPADIFSNFLINGENP